MKLLTAVASVLVGAMVLSGAVAPVMGASVTDGAPAVTSSGVVTDVPDDAVFNTTNSNVNVWQEALLPLRVDRSDAATRVDNPDLRVRCIAVGERSFGQPDSGVFNPGDTVEMEFDDARAGSGGLADTRVKLVAVRVTGDTEAIPTTYSEAVDLLEQDSALDETLHFTVGTATLDSEGRATFSTRLQEPGHYTFFAVNPPRNVKTEAGTLTVEDEVTLLGIDTATVQTRAASVDGTTENVAPADGIQFDVDATNRVGDSDVTHSIVVYNEDQLVGSTHTIAADSADLGPGFDSTTDTAIRQSIDGTVGVSNIDEGAYAGGVDLSDGTVARQANIQGLVDFIGQNASETDADALDENANVLYASTTSVTETDGERSVVVSTTDEWSDGQYRYVYIAQRSDDGTVLSSTTGTVDVAASNNLFSGGVPGFTNRVPHDLNGDGLYEDVNGDGEETLGDVFDLAFNVIPEAGGYTQAQVDSLDFSGDGELNFVDVFALAFS